MPVNTKGDHALPVNTRKETKKCHCKFTTSKSIKRQAG